MIEKASKQNKVSLGYHGNLEGDKADKIVREKTLVFIILSYMLILVAAIFLMKGIASIYNQGNVENFTGLIYIPLAGGMLIFYKRLINYDKLARLIFIGFGFVILLIPLSMLMNNIIRILPLLIGIGIIYIYRENKIIKNSYVFLGVVGAFIILSMMDIILIIGPGLFIIYVLMIDADTVALFYPDRAPPTKEYKKMNLL